MKKLFLISVLAVLCGCTVAEQEKTSIGLAWGDNVSTVTHDGVKLIVYRTGHGVAMVVHPGNTQPKGD